MRFSRAQNKAIVADAVAQKTAELSDEIEALENELGLQQKLTRRANRGQWFVGLAFGVIGLLTGLVVGQSAAIPVLVKYFQ